MFLKILATIFVFLPLTAYAAESVYITGIAASYPTEFEWIEVTNMSEGFIDLSEWRFVEGFTLTKPHGTKHKLIPLGDSLVEPGEKVVIAQDAASYMNAYPDYTGKLFDSSWSSLKENGERVELIDENEVVVDSFTYMPTHEGILVREEPYSLNRWYGTLEGGDFSTSIDVPEPPPEVSEGQVIPPSTGGSMNVTVGEPVVFDSGSNVGVVEWDFDDGDTESGSVVEHSFEQEGDYHVALLDESGEKIDEVKVVVQEVKKTEEEVVLRTQEKKESAPTISQKSEPESQVLAVTTVNEVVTLPPPTSNKPLVYKYALATLIAIALAGIGFKIREWRLG